MGKTSSPLLANLNRLLPLLVHAAPTLGALGGNAASGLHVILGTSTVDVLLEHWVRVELLEFGLEVLQAGGVGGAVRAAAGVVDVEALVLDFFTIDTPGVVSVVCFNRSREGYGSKGGGELRLEVSRHTSFLYRHRSSWSSSGQHRCDQPWQRSGGDAPQRWQCHRQDRRGRGR